MFKLRRRKRTRYQCKDCLKTFYKPGYKMYLISFDCNAFPCCPYCGGDFIIV